VEATESKGIITIAKFGRICGIFFIPLGIGGLFQAQGVVSSLLCLIGLPFIGISLIVSGTFMIRFKQWARYLFIAQMYLMGIMGIWIMIEGMPKSHFSISELFSFSLMFIPLFLLPTGSIYYLTRPKVKERFK